MSSGDALKVSWIHICLMSEVCCTDVIYLFPDLPRLSYHHCLHILVY